MKSKLYMFMGLVAFAFLPINLSADVKPANIITDNMVLQKGMPVRIWGTADAGEKVFVKFMNKSASTIADKKGYWRIDLPAPKSYVKTGEEMLIQGKNKIVLKDILVGEVWLGSGQSNMEFHIRHVKDTENYIKENGIKNVRYFMVKGNGSETPKNMHELPAESKWEKFDKENFKANREMSIILSFFAKRLNETLDVPVGLINVSFGGANLETWLSAQAIADAGTTNDCEKLLQRCKQWHKDDIKRWEALPDDERAKRPFPRLNYESRPSNSFNAMVNPLIPYSFRGLLWYQGEMNSGMEMYLKEFPCYAKMMRTLFENPKMPIYTVQLPDYKENHWPKTRDTQRKLADIVENSGLAVTIDGNEIDLHPRDKTMVTDRLLRLALANTYGYKDIVSHSPMPVKLSKKSNSIIVKFKNCYKGLKLKDGNEVRTFEVGDEKGNFVSAKAKIVSKDTVEIEIPDGLSNHSKLRYAWAADPDVNLYNSGDLPASPFEEPIEN